MDRNILTSQFLSPTITLVRLCLFRFSFGNDGNVIHLRCVICYARRMTQVGRITETSHKIVFTHGPEFLFPFEGAQGFI